MKNYYREIEYWWGCFRCGEYNKEPDNWVASVEPSIAHECPKCKELSYVNFQLALDTMNDNYIKEHYED